MMQKNNFKLIKNPEVDEVFAKHSSLIQAKLLHLRELILATAKETEGINQLEETLKWGEPSYLAKKGSTIRLNKRKSNPNQYAIFFKCTSKLVLTFQEIYGDTFKYEKTRAIVFDLEDEIPVTELKHCIQLALTYHQVKHLPLLGV